MGTVSVLGRTPRRDLDLFGRIGLVPEAEALPEHLDAASFVRLGAELRKVSEPGRAAEAALRTVDLDPTDRRGLRTYSKGMRQRAKLAHALVSDPEVLVADEPFNGLDPRQRVHMMEVFRNLAAQGRCVFVSSHVLEDVERLGSRVLVLARGRLLATGDFHAVRELLDDRPHRVLVRAGDVRKLAARLVAGGSVSGVHLDPEGNLHVDVADATAFRRAVAAEAKKAGVRLFEVRPVDDDLDSVFRYLMERVR
jgi:ABC-2 type transport system ATP-binding protein